MAWNDRGYLRHRVLLGRFLPGLAHGAIPDGGYAHGGPALPIAILVAGNILVAAEKGVGGVLRAGGVSGESVAPQKGQMELKD